MRLPNVTGEWNWQWLSRFVPMSDIRLHPDLPWNREGLSWNNEMTVEAMNHLDQVMTNVTDEWNWWRLSMHVPIGDVIAHPNLPWNRRGLSLNKQMTVSAKDELDDLLTEATEEWVWTLLSSSISMEEIRQRPDLPWSEIGLALNPGVTVDDVLYLGVTSIIGMTVSMEEIKANPLFRWSKRHMSYNPWITIEMVLANME